jgi:hypothetical protein
VSVYPDNGTDDAVGLGRWWSVRIVHTGRQRAYRSKRTGTVQPRTSRHQSWEHNLITNAMSRVRPSVQGVADTGGVGVSEGFLSRIGETLDER